MPTKYCDMHVSVSVCEESGSAASPFCPEEGVEEVSFVLIRPSSQFARYDDEYLLKAMPNCVRVESSMNTEMFRESLSTCTIHAGESLSVFELRTSAEALISDVEAFLDANEDLNDSERQLLVQGIQSLQEVLDGYEYSVIETRVNSLRTDYNNIRGQAE